MIGKSHRRVALAMVGRGTSDPEALAHMRRVTELASQERSLAWVSTGFFAGGIPSVDELLAQAAAIPSSELASSALTTQTPACDTVVIQPHLLFEGELMDQLRARILRCRQESPDRQWILARCLGADDGLAGVFIEFIRSYQGLEGLTESTGESLQES